VALLPDKHREPPLSVDDQGVDHDWKRFEKREAQVEAANDGVGDRNHVEGADELVQRVLEAAVVCVVCGGRWMRA
jgi:hypothetical protein